MRFTPDAALSALTNDELVDQFAIGQWPTWQVQHVLNARGADMMDAVLQGLQHAHPQVRRWCAELLDHNGDARCIGPLMALMSDPVDHVRWQAVHSLSCQRCKVLPLEIDAQVTARMTELMLHDPSIRVRKEALAALKLRPEAAAPELQDTLRAVSSGLAQRTSLSKRERAYQRALSRVVST